METTVNRIDLRRIWRTVRQCKWIYMALVVVLTAIGIWKSVIALPNLEATGAMLIGEIGYDESGKAGGMAQMMKTFSVGGFGGAAVDNELLIMSSHDVMLRTIRALGTNRSYIGVDSDGQKALLYKDTPIRVEAPVEFFDTLSTPFKIMFKIKDNGLVDITATKGFFNKCIKEVSDAKLPMLLETPCGNVQVMPTDLFASSEYRKVTVTISGNNSCALQLSSDMEIDVATKLSDVIELKYSCPNAVLGMATVNGVMSEYNAKRLERLHEASLASIKYYDERIAEAFEELQTLEYAVSNYQRTNQLMGVDSELGLLVNTAVGNKPAIMTANYNIAYYETVLDILRNRLNDDVIIPQMESLNDPHIDEFNGAIQARRNLKRSATDDNDVLQRLNDKIKGLRDIIIENSEKMIAKSRADVAHQQELTNAAQSRLDQYPDYQLEFHNLLRDKEYKNALYQYLVHARDNSVLQLYSTTNIGFTFQPAYISGNGGLLSLLKWPVAMLILALFLGSCVALVMLLTHRNVSDTIDLAFMGIDANAVKYDSGNDSIARLRTTLTAKPERKTIYSANFSENSTPIIELTRSLTDIGYTVETVEAGGKNDNLLSPEFAAELKRMESTADYVVIDIPQPEKLFEFEHLIDSSNASLLVTIPDTIKRGELKKYLKGQTADRIYSIIVK